MSKISFTVWGAPGAQPRQRHTPLMKDGRPVIGKGGRPVILNYTAAKDPVTQWKSDIKQAALLAEGEVGNLWEGPVTLTVNFFLPRPAKYCRRKDSAESVPCLTKPDLDNLIKAVKDALSGVIYRDDKQIWTETVRKKYHEIGGRPRAEIHLEELA